MRDIILLPTYNERENIKNIVPAVARVLPGASILVIDDSSPDGTADAVRELVVAYPQLSLLERQGKTGLGDAYTDAMQRVIKDPDVRFVITMDADGSHAPEHLPELIAEAQHHDLVVGSRYVRGGGIAKWELWRKLLSYFGNQYASRVAGLPVRDCTSGFMCIRKNALQQVRFGDISSSGYSFLIELKFYLTRIPGARATEVPIMFQSRAEGESKISNQIISEGMKAPWRLLAKRLWG